MLLPPRLLRGASVCANLRSEAADFYKVPAEHIIVLCDDISLPVADALSVLSRDGDELPDGAPAPSLRLARSAVDAFERGSISRTDLADFMIRFRAVSLKAGAVLEAESLPETGSGSATVSAIDFSPHECVR